jgi:ubiquitin-protein ligase
VFAPTLSSAQIADAVKAAEAKDAAKTNSKSKREANSKSKRILEECTAVTAGAGSSGADAVSAYAGGAWWLLAVSFGSNYPLKPPQVRFVTPV